MRCGGRAGKKRHIDLSGLRHFMPYKARLKAGEPRNRPMPNYAATNAHEYNESLRRRGQLSLYCPDGDSDEAGLDAVLAVEANVDCVIADAAYYSIAQA